MQEDNRLRYFFCKLSTKQSSGEVTGTLESFEWNCLVTWLNLMCHKHKVFFFFWIYSYWAPFFKRKKTLNSVYIYIFFNTGYHFLKIKKTKLVITVWTVMPSINVSRFTPFEIDQGDKLWTRMTLNLICKHYLFQQV